jgi:hypothetical protein
MAAMAETAAARAAAAETVGVVVVAAAGVPGKLRRLCHRRR